MRGSDRARASARVRAFVTRSSSGARARFRFAAVPRTRAPAYGRVLRLSSGAGASGTHVIIPLYMALSTGVELAMGGADEDALSSTQYVPANPFNQPSRRASLVLKACAASPS
jgi:hypothetical protein